MLLSMTSLHDHACFLCTHYILYIQYFLDKAMSGLLKVGGRQIQERIWRGDVRFIASSISSLSVRGRP